MKFTKLQIIAKLDNHFGNDSKFWNNAKIQFNYSELLAIYKNVYTDEIENFAAKF